MQYHLNFLKKVRAVSRVRLKNDSELTVLCFHSMERMNQTYILPRATFTVEPFFNLKLLQVDNLQRNDAYFTVQVFPKALACNRLTKYPLQNLRKVI